MRMIDIRCTACEAIVLDWLQRDVDNAFPACEQCGQPTERVHLPSTLGGVIPDDIPGGMMIRHGLCNKDGSPRRFASKSAMRKEAAKRGWTNVVEHKGSKGSDKSKHTVRWT